VLPRPLRLGGRRRDGVLRRSASPYRVRIASPHFLHVVGSGSPFELDQARTRPAIQAFGDLLNMVRQRQTSQRANMRPHKSTNVRSRAKPPLVAFILDRTYTHARRFREPTNRNPNP